MDAIPTDTHVAEVAATVDDLEGGLALFPLSKAVNRIDDWRRTIRATENPTLVPVADGLADLHRALTGEGVSGHVVGPILVRLGEQTEAAATGAAAELQGALQRLGSLLRHAGAALDRGGLDGTSGGAADGTTDGTSGGAADRVAGGTADAA